MHFYNANYFSFFDIKISNTFFSDLRLWLILSALFLHCPSFSQKSFSLNFTNSINIETRQEFPGCVDANTTNSLGAINVSGVATLNTTDNRLARIELQLDPACGGNFRDLIFIVKKMPSGPCFYFYDGNSVSTTSVPSTAGIQTINLIDNPTCGANLSVPDFTSAQNQSKTTTGNTGYFKAGCHTCSSQAPTVTLASAFNSIDPNGEWRIYYFYDGVAGNAPCFKGVSLIFGDPAATDQRPNGDNCETAIEWTGRPFCATSQSKTGSLLMPGSCTPNTNFTSPTKIGGTTCEWNFANNNDVWIKYTAVKAGYVCISVSGLSIDQQSIVVTDANADNDNRPCTQLNSLKTCLSTNNGGTNDPYWNVVSCPRNRAYNTTAGSPFNQQHCFTTSEGTTYYLIVDGTDGVPSPFYVSGLTGTSEVTLNSDLLSFNAEVIANGNKIKWQYSLDPAEVKSYELQRSGNGQQFYFLSNWIIGSPDQSGKVYTFLDKNPSAEINFYRLKVVHKNGLELYSSVVQLKGHSQSNINIFPNPVTDFLNIQSRNTIARISIYNGHGQFVYSNTALRTYFLKIPAQSWAKGRYIVFVTDVNGNTESLSFTR